MYQSELKSTKVYQIVLMCTKEYLCEPKYQCVLKCNLHSAVCIPLCVAKCVKVKQSEAKCESDAKCVKV